MIISRGLNLLKTICVNNKNTAVLRDLRSVRLCHGEMHYRKLPPKNKNWIFGAELVGGFLWWWILWHLWHDFGHIVGEFPYPDSSKWTDEELGIPPDDVDD
ncbi:hypothetical protein HN011_007807 [Eciton burchellii]|nr:hypothetical protein HN011_007807 [Eciton burchellii]